MDCEQNKKKIFDWFKSDETLKVVTRKHLELSAKLIRINDNCEYLLCELRRKNSMITKKLVYKYESICSCITRIIMVLNSDLEGLMCSELPFKFTRGRKIYEDELLNIYYGCKRDIIKMMGICEPIDTFKLSDTTILTSPDVSIMNTFIQDSMAMLHSIREQTPVCFQDVPKLELCCKKINRILNNVNRLM